MVKLLWKYRKELEIKCIFFIIFRFVCNIKNGKYKKDPNTKAFNCLEFECRRHLNLGPAFKWHLNTSPVFKRHLNPGLKWRSFEYWTIFHYLKTGQAGYSDPHCNLVISWAEPNNLQNDYHKCFFYHSRVSEDNCNSDFILVHLKSVSIFFVPAI